MLKKQQGWLKKRTDAEEERITSRDRKGKGHDGRNNEQEHEPEREEEKGKGEKGKKTEKKKIRKAWRDSLLSFQSVRITI